MSHRVTYDSEMKDAELLSAALKSTEHTFSKNGTTIRITAGKLAPASIDLRTGNIISDSDWNQKNADFGILRQAYSEEEFMADALRKGVTIESRTVVEGKIVLKCRAVAVG